MNIVVAQPALLSAINHAAGVAGKSQSPITGNLLLSVVDGGLTVEGTDLDMVATVFAPSDIIDASGPEKVTASATHLREIVSKSPKGIAIELSWGDAPVAMKVRADRSSFTIGVMLADAWIDFDRGEPATSFEVEAKVLADALRFVRGGVAEAGKGREFLAGVFFDVEDGNLRLVAGDGNMLRVADTHSPTTLPVVVGGEPSSCVVPTKAVERILAIAEETEVSLRINTDGRKITVRSTTTSLCSKLLEGRYPSYRRVIPKYDFAVLSDRDDLLKAIQRVSFLAAPTVSVKLSVAQEAMEVSVRTVGQDAASSSIRCELTDREPFNVFFSHRYVAPVLSSLTGDTVEIGMTDPRSPAIFRCLNAPDRFSVISPRSA